MSKEKDYIEMEATVLEVLPDKIFRLDCAGEKILAHIIGGRPKQRKLKIYPGDKVKIMRSIYDRNRAFINDKA